MSEQHADLLRAVLDGLALHLVSGATELTPERARLVLRRHLDTLVAPG